MEETADEMGENCKLHVVKMIQAGDEDHKKSHRRDDGTRPRRPTKMAHMMIIDSITLINYHLSIILIKEYYA
jgi:hypothetical protein